MATCGAVEDPRARQLLDILQEAWPEAGQRLQLLAGELLWYAASRPGARTSSAWAMWRLSQRS